MLIENEFGEAAVRVFDLLETKDPELQMHFFNHARRAFVCAMAAYGQHVVVPEEVAKHHIKHAWVEDQERKKSSRAR